MRSTLFILSYALILLYLLSSTNISQASAQNGLGVNYYVFPLRIMGENYIIAIKTNGTIENFRYTNFTFGWHNPWPSWYNITIPKLLNNTKILARSDCYTGAYRPNAITMNETHYFLYYCAESRISDIFFGAPHIEISVSASTAYVGFKVEINGNVTYKDKPVPNWPVILVAYNSPLKGDVWWECMHLPVTLITTVNTTSDGSFRAIWMPTASGSWWISAGLKNPWPPTNEDYPEEASASASLAVTPYADKNVFSVVSNATVSGLAFNSTSRELSFTVEGAGGTSGVIDVYVSKDLLADARQLKVYLNATQLNLDQYTVGSKDDAWHVHLTISFASKYLVTINLATPEEGVKDYWAYVTIGTIIAAGGVIGIFVVIKKKRGLNRKTHVMP